MTGPRIDVERKAIKVRLLKLATFENADLAALQTAVNDWLGGQALTSGESGTVAYSADSVGNRILFGEPRLLSNGSTYVLSIWYTEG